MDKKKFNRLPGEGKRDSKPSGKMHNVRESDTFSTLSEKEVRQLMGKGAYPCIVDLSGSNYRLNSDDFIPHFTNCLKELDLSNNHLSEINGLSFLSKLKRLKVNDNKLSKINLSGLVGLEYLSLSGNSFDLVPDMTDLKNLVNVNMSRNKLKRGFSEFVKASKLQVIDISNNNFKMEIEEVNGFILLQLRKLPELKYLTISGNPIEKKIPSFRHWIIFELPKLQVLNSEKITKQERTQAIEWESKWTDKNKPVTLGSNIKKTDSDEEKSDDEDEEKSEEKQPEPEPEPEPALDDSKSVPKSMNEVEINFQQLEDILSSETEANKPDPIAQSHNNMLNTPDVDSLDILKGMLNETKNNPPPSSPLSSSKSNIPQSSSSSKAPARPPTRTSSKPPTRSAESKVRQEKPSSSRQQPPPSSQLDDFDDLAAALEDIEQTQVASKEVESKKQLHKDDFDLLDDLTSQLSAPHEPPPSSGGGSGGGGDFDEIDELADLLSGGDEASDLDKLLASSFVSVKPIQNELDYLLDSLDDPPADSKPLSSSSKVKPAPLSSSSSSKVKPSSSSARPTPKAKPKQRVKPKEDDLFGDLDDVLNEINDEPEKAYDPKPMPEPVQETKPKTTQSIVQDNYGFTELEDTINELESKLLPSDRPSAFAENEQSRQLEIREEELRRKEERFKKEREERERVQFEQKERERKLAKQEETFRRQADEMRRRQEGVQGLNDSPYGGGRGDPYGGGKGDPYGGGRGDPYGGGRGDPYGGGRGDPYGGGRGDPYGGGRGDPYGGGRGDPYGGSGRMMSAGRGAQVDSYPPMDTSYSSNNYNQTTSSYNNYPPANSEFQRREQEMLRKEEELRIAEQEWERQKREEEARYKEEQFRLQEMRERERRERMESERRQQEENERRRRNEEEKFLREAEEQRRLAREREEEARRQEEEERRRAVEQMRREEEERIRRENEERRREEEERERRLNEERARKSREESLRRAKEMEEREAELQRREEGIRKRLEQDALERRKREERIMKEQQDMLENELKNLAYPWKAKWKDLTFGEKLGIGVFGTTSKGLWRGMEVTIKQLRCQSYTDAFLQRCLDEIPPLAGLRHPQLIEYAGVCVENTISAICPFIHGTPLYGMIRNSGVEIDDKLKIHLLLQISDGMKHMHENGIMHLSLKTKNIIVDNDMNVKIRDFGWKLIKDQVAIAGAIGTPEYDAPELLRGDPYDHLIDVYSFAICTWELWTRQTPYLGTLPRQIIQSVIHEQLRPPIDEITIPPAMCKLMKQSWCEQSGNRMTFSRIFDYLSKPLEELLDYPVQNVTVFTQHKAGVEVVGNPFATPSPSSSSSSSIKFSGGSGGGSHSSSSSIGTGGHGYQSRDGSMNEKASKIIVVLNKIIELLKVPNEPAQVKGLKAIHNIATDPSNAAALEHQPLIEAIMTTLYSTFESVQEHAALTVSEMSKYAPVSEVYLRKGIFPILLSVLRSTNESVVLNTLKAITNILSYAEQQDCKTLFQSSGGVQKLAEVLNSSVSHNDFILQQTLTAMSVVLDHENIKKTVNEVTMQPVVSLLDHSHTPLKIPLLVILSHVASCHTGAVCLQRLGVKQKLFPLLQSPNSEIQQLAVNVSDLLNNLSSIDPSPHGSSSRVGIGGSGSPSFVGGIGGGGSQSRVGGISGSGSQSRVGGISGSGSQSRVGGSPVSPSSPPSGASLAGLMSPDSNMREQSAVTAFNMSQDQNQKHSIVSGGGLPGLVLLVQNLSHNTPTAVDNTILALANLSDDQQLRRSLVSEGALDAMVRFLIDYHYNLEQSLKTRILWAIANFALDGENQHLLFPVIPVLIDTVQQEGQLQATSLKIFLILAKNVNAKNELLRLGADHILGPLAQSPNRTLSMASTKILNLLNS